MKGRNIENAGAGCGPTAANAGVSRTRSDGGTYYPHVLTVDELAALLRVNRDTAYKAIKAGEIPGARKIGRNIRISRDAVLDWLRGKSRVLRSSRRNA